MRARESALLVLFFLSPFCFRSKNVGLLGDGNVRQFPSAVMVALPAPAKGVCNGVFSTLVQNHVGHIVGLVRSAQTQLRLGRTPIRLLVYLFYQEGDK